MKILLALLLGCSAFGQGILAPIRNGLNVSTGGGGSITLLHSTSCGLSASGTACTITATTAGSALIIPIINNNPTGVVTGITGVTATQVSSCAGSIAASGAYDVWYVQAPTTGTTSITINITVGQYLTVVYEIAGMKTSSPGDGACQILNTGGTTTSPTSPSFSPSTSPDFAVANLAPSGSCSAIAGGSLWTNDTTTGGYCIAHLITTNSSAIQANWTTTSGTYGSNIMAFLAQ